MIYGLCGITLDNADGLAFFTAHIGHGHGRKSVPRQFFEQIRIIVCRYGFLINMGNFIALLQSADCGGRILRHLCRINRRIVRIEKCDDTDADFSAFHFVFKYRVFRRSHVTAVFVAQALGITARQIGIEQIIVNFTVIIVADNVVQFRNGCIKLGTAR